ncbi:MAG: ABC transporter substrate-binding protein [Chloroflexota bacterium]|nr:ABC transporter substrate-binding protein [Chloroflexota bacterium]
MRIWSLTSLILALTLILAGCAGQSETPTLQDVTLMLDWVPNTNHTGIYVAQANGYFEDAGLKVTIIEPGEVYAEHAVAAEAADFGVSFQEQVTLARADEVPIVSIAAVIQHNSSGFASRAELGAHSPRDWEGLRYGSFGSPFEPPTLQVLMNCDGGEFEALEIVDTGFSDPLALLDEAVTDLAWIFYGWQGIQAEYEGIDLQIVMMEDWFDCIPDYYTPVFIASEKTIRERPQVVRAFLEAIEHGYRFAIDNPDRAADILLKAVPELNDDLVHKSQSWLSPRYQADASRWGEQDTQVWQAYSAWMVENGILAESIQAEDAFTNEYLPGSQ